MIHGSRKKSPSSATATIVAVTFAIFQILNDVFCNSWVLSYDILCKNWIYLVSTAMKNEKIEKRN